MSRPPREVVRLLHLVRGRRRLQLVAPLLAAFLLAGALAIPANALSDSFSITSPFTTAEEVADTLFSEGVTPVDGSVKINDGGAPGLALGSFGRFTGGAVDLGIEDGLVIAANADATSFATDGPPERLSDNRGDPDLEALLQAEELCSGASCVHNATSLEFQVLPTDDFLKFEYVLAVTETGTYGGGWTGNVLNFPDGFGLFIDGHNCAVVPGGPNEGSYLTMLNAQIAAPQGNAAANRAQAAIEGVYAYAAEDPDWEVQFLTLPLTCVADVSTQAVEGSPVTVKIVIADANDGEVPPAVFLEGGSVRFEDTPDPPPTRTLSITTDGAGTGTVTSTPAGIDCGAICTHDFEEDTTVALHAAPSPGSRFEAWGGDCGPDGEVTLTADAECTATFALNSTDASLDALALSVGDLDPVFDAGTVDYTVSVPNATTSITVTPTAAHGGATITVNGTPVPSGDPSGAVALAVGPNTITVVVTAEDGTTTETYTVTVTRASAPAPVEEPDEPAGPDIIEAAGEVRVPVTGRTHAPLSGTTDTNMRVAAPGGSSATVTIPLGALPEGLPGGLRLEVAPVADVTAVIEQAPPSGADVVAQFVVRLVDPAGNRYPLAFAGPVRLEFVVPASDVPADVGLDRLALVYWDGETWIEVNATAEVNADGSVTLVSEVQHFTLFSVIWTPEGWGTFDPMPAARGVSLSRWLGGSLGRMEAALGEGNAFWTRSDNRWLSYVAGAPAFLNANFIAAYPEAVPAHTMGVVTR